MAQLVIERKKKQRSNSYEKYLEQAFIMILFGAVVLRNNTNSN